MNREEYRQALDDVPFSAGFQEETAELLRQRARELEKEKLTMSFGKTKKLAAAIAAAVALLAVSVSAAMLWLTPAQVAEYHDQPLLAKAFESEDAVLLNETVNSGDYSITLLGLTSGEALTTWDQNAEVSHTYAVLALRRLDGAALENRSFAFTSYTMTPLVAGYAPTAVNNWTLDAFATGFAQDGVYYYLLDTQDLGIFADHTVYMAFYEGGAPSNSIFTMAEDGAISFAEDFTGVQALFTLPLDDSLADPAAAAKYVQDTGWSNDLSVTSEDREGGILIGGEDADGGVTASFHVSDGSEALDLYTAETYEAYMLEEKERLRQEVDKGVLSQVNYSTSVKEMEEVLEGIRNGTMFAARLENGGVLTGTVLDAQGFSGEYQTTRDGVSMTIRDSKG